MSWQAHSLPLACARFSVDEAAVLTSDVEGTIYRWNATQLVKAVLQAPGFTSKPTATEDGIW